MAPLIRQTALPSSTSAPVDSGWTTLRSFIHTVRHAPPCTASSSSRSRRTATIGSSSPLRAGGLPIPVPATVMGDRSDMSLSLLPTAAPPRAGSATPAALVARLGAALANRDIAHCQWKGHGRRERWETGRGDIDLLVDSRSWADFTEVLGTLGFKLALPPSGREAAGILHYFGLDQRTGQLIHLHVYQRLVIGLPWRAHYRLPLERVLLDSATLRDGASSVFKTAAPELELIVAVLRLSLRHSLRDTLRREPPRWLDG